MKEFYSSELVLPRTHYDTVMDLHSFLFISSSKLKSTNSKTGYARATIRPERIFNNAKLAELCEINATMLDSNELRLLNDKEGVTVENDKIMFDESYETNYYPMSENKMVYGVKMVVSKNDASVFIVRFALYGSNRSVKKMISQSTFAKPRVVKKRNKPIASENPYNKLQDDNHSDTTSTVE